MLSRRTSTSRTRLAHAEQRHHRPIPITRRLNSRLQKEGRQTDFRQHDRRRRRRHLWQRQRHRLREDVNRLLLHLRCFRHRRHVRCLALTLLLGTALSHTANSARSVHSSFVTTSLPTATPAVLMQNVSHTLQANIHIEPLPDRRRSICKTGVRSLSEEIKNPLHI